METSNRTDYLLGTLRVPASEISPEEWANILNETLKNLRPYLKYLSSKQFSLIKHHLNCFLSCDVTPCDRRFTIEQVIQFKDDINEKIDCCILTDLFKDDIHREKDGESTEIKLLLTRKGKLILWKAEYEVQNRKSQDTIGRSSYKEYIATLSEFMFIDESYLVQLLTEFSEIDIQIGPANFSEIPVGYNALKSLQDIIQYDVKKRSSRLKKIRETGESVSSTIDRIYW